MLALLLGANTCAAQKYIQSGTTFTQVNTNNSKSTATKTVYTWKIGNKSYPIYISSKGKAFIYKTSKKTGKEYKYYLPDEVAQKIKNKK